MEGDVTWTDGLLARIGLEAPGRRARPVQRRGLLADLADLGRTWAGWPEGPLAQKQGMELRRALRRRVAWADEETRAAARDRGAEIREGADLALRCVIAFVFPGEHAWARADAEACLGEASGGAVRAPAQLLLGSLDDVDLARRLLASCLLGGPLEGSGDLALEIVRGLGARAAPVLEVLLAAAEKEPGRKTEVRRVLEAVALIPREDAAALLAARLSGTDGKTIAARYFQACPALAMRVLPPIAGGRTKVSEVARTLLSAVLADHPDIAASALPELAAAGRRAVAAVRDRAEVRGDEATPDEVPAVLARPPWHHLEDRALPVIKVDTDEAIPPFPLSERDAWASRIHWVPNALVFSPKVAPAVGHAFLHRPDDRAAAEAWLRAFPEIAAAGLIPASLRDPSATRLDAERALRFLATVDRQAVAQAATRYPATVGAAVERVLAVHPRHDCPFEPPKLPDFARVDALPRPVIAASGRALPREAARHLLEMLVFAAQSPSPYVGAAEVKAACDPASLDAFAWALFEAFLAAGAPARAGWALEALGVIGGDDVARRLAAKVRAWPAERAIARAATGIDVLARIGTDVALMHLSSFAERMRTGDLEVRARARLAEAARARGLLPEELADRVVPDLDLDADGGKALSFGPRSFRVGFDEHLDPVVWGEDGAVLRGLPRPGKTDDADKARAAAETWKALKHDAEAIAGGQIQRLEQAMISGRRWDPATFRALLVNHPLLVHLVRRLLFSTYDGDGRPTLLFRVAEDRTFADLTDAPIAIDGAAAVGLPHALDLPREALSAWGTLFADYQLLQPFPQIGREVFTATDEERSGFIIKRFDGVQVETVKLFSLEHRGWRRSAFDAVSETFYRDLPGGRWMALHLSPGLNLANPREPPVQQLTSLWLVERHNVSPVLRDLPPILFSEVVRDVSLLIG